jgi:integrase
MKIKLAILKDLGLRPIELTWLKIQDIDLSTGKVSITGAKHTVGREGKLKAKTLELIKFYLSIKNLKQASKIYNGKSSNLSANYHHYRNRIAKKYNKPELKQIQLYDFRRLKASKEYHLHHNLLYVKEILDPKDPLSSLLFCNIFLLIILPRKKRGKIRLFSVSIVLTFCEGVQILQLRVQQG